MEAVLGSEAARVMKLAPGATFTGQHGLTMGGDPHGDRPYRVTGILAPTGAVIDRLILTDTASVWKVGRVVTRTMLLEQVWEFHFDPKTNIVDTHICRLRAKIGGPGDPELIHTVRGAGYILDEHG